MLHEFKDIISILKQEDKHFHNLFDKHNKLDDEITKLETSGVDHADTFTIEKMKKEKLLLKDKLYSIILHKKNELQNK